MKQDRYFSVNQDSQYWRLVFGEPGAVRAGKMICVPAGPSGDVKEMKPFLNGV